jgi:hypothetical protein
MHCRQIRTQHYWRSLPPRKVDVVFLRGINHNLVNINMACITQTKWPSGLRRTIQVRVFIGVGSNPTFVTTPLSFFYSVHLSFCCWCYDAVPLASVELVSHSANNSHHVAAAAATGCKQHCAISFYAISCCRAQQSCM